MKAFKSAFFSLIVLLSLNTTASAAPLFQEPPEILYVKQGEAGDCSSWEEACDLQTAIGKLPDQIWVAAGTYIPTTTSDRSISFEMESGLKIFGGFPADGGAWEDRNWELYPTILSGDLNGDDGENFTNNGENSYHILTATDVNRLAKLDGFIISGGNANGGSGESTSFGAGMYNINSSPTLTNLTFTGNFSTYGGAGMYNFDNSSPTLISVTLLGNKGGGMYNNKNSSPTLTDLSFTANTERPGMTNQDNSNSTLKNVTFTGNTSGGMHNENSSAILTNVLFAGNSAEYVGGGITNQGGSTILTNVSFIRNTAGLRGGGMYNAGNNTHPTLTNVTFSGNTAGQGGGIYNDYSGSTLINVTFFNNTAFNGNGGALYNYSPQVDASNLINTILWENTPDQIFNEGSTLPDVSYSVIQGGYPGGTNIILDDPLLGPLADNGGFTQTHALLAGSSAIDTGDLAACPETDQRGVRRPIGSGCDIGSYEFEPKIFLPMVIK